MVYTSNGASGQFEWTTGFRLRNTEAQLFGGEISVIGGSGALDYTVSLSNENNRFGADGPVSITDRDGALIESQYSKLSGKFDNPKISTAFSYDFGGDVTANLNLSYGSDFFSRKEPETAIDSAGVTRTREALVEEDGPEYELGGDIQFPFGPGSLKLILLERFERDNYSSSVIDRLSDDSPPRGFRFEQTAGAGERIGRLEYDWKLWGADWQLSGEAAFNRLDRRSRLFELAPGGEFVQLAFPQGNGGVTEDRYDASLSISRSLSSTLSVQVIGAMEFSTIEQTGFAANSRSFKRPKGSSPRPGSRDDFDISVTLAKRQPAVLWRFLAPCRSTTTIRTAATMNWSHIRVTTSRSRRTRPSAHGARSSSKPAKRGSRISSTGFRFPAEAKRAATSAMPTDCTSRPMRRSTSIRSGFAGLGSISKWSSAT